MPLQIIRQDITRVNCDAIVNAANETLLGGGGVDGAIHRAAGPELLRECRGLGGCRTGEAKLTGGYRLPCNYVIHTVGPVWHGGGYGEREKLISCYRNSLELAKAHGCESVAFPLISAGAYGYPKDQALRVAVDTISAFLTENEMLVYLVIFGRQDYQIGSKLFADISSFIDDNYADAHTDLRLEQLRSARYASAAMHMLQEADDREEAALLPEEAETAVPAPKARPEKQKKPRKTMGGLFRKKESVPAAEAIPSPAAACPPFAPAVPSMAELPLKAYLEQIDESFSQMLLRKIDEAGMTDAQCYKKANIDRKLFSKIRSDPAYRPSKPTVLAFAIALELPLEETRDMLMKAGFALSHSSRFDLIVEYFIQKRNYNVFEINEALFAFDQCLLGG